jgi:hypothetical protein
MSDVSIVGQRLTCGVGGPVFYPSGVSVPAWRNWHSNVVAELNAQAKDQDTDDDVVGLFRPLDGITKANSQRKNGVGVSYEYYIQIVPTILELYVDNTHTHTHTTHHNMVTDLVPRLLWVQP